MWRSAGCTPYGCAVIVALGTVVALTAAGWSRLPVVVSGLRRGSGPGGAGGAGGECVAAHVELGLIDGCVAQGEQVVVQVRLTGWAGNCPEMVGGQFLLRYNATKIEFVDASPGDGLNAIAYELYEVVDPQNGTIDYAVGSAPADPQHGITEGVLATLRFHALVQDCTADDLIGFREHEPPTRLIDADGVYYDALHGTLTLADLPLTVVDFTPPVIICPPDITLATDAGSECNHYDDPGVASAQEYICGSEPVASAERSDGQPIGAPFCVGDSPITITWTAEDECGNRSQCRQVVRVLEIGRLTATVELKGGVAGGPFTRCVTFELWDCDSQPPTVTEVEAEITFTNRVGTTTLAIPPGDYECITARDRLHTLRKVDSDDFGIVGDEYVADFTDRTATGGDDDALTGGNANGDQYIDILDFGLWAANYGAWPGADTTCATPSPHPDFSGDGLVDEFDFSFVQINFFAWDETGCCGGAALDGSGPRERVLVRELDALGYGELVPLDLNHDGWLDTTDMELWQAGLRPGPQPSSGSPGWGCALLP